MDTALATESKINRHLGPGLAGHGGLAWTLPWPWNPTGCSLHGMTPLVTTLTREPRVVGAGSLSSCWTPACPPLGIPNLLETVALLREEAENRSPQRLAILDKPPLPPLGLPKGPPFKNHLPLRPPLP